MNKENFGKTEVFVYFSGSIANSVDQQCGLPGWARRFTQEKNLSKSEIGRFSPCSPFKPTIQITDFSIKFVSPEGRNKVSPAGLPAPPPPSLPPHLCVVKRELGQRPRTNQRRPFLRSRRGERRAASGNRAASAPTANNRKQEKSEVDFLL